MDNLCDTIGALGVGINFRLYDWRIYSYFDCSRCYRCADTSHSGQETLIKFTSESLDVLKKV